MTDETRRRGRLLAGGGVDYSKPARDEYPPTPERRSTTMPVVNIPAGVRLALYVLSGLGSVVVAYLFAKELIGEAEGALWAGVVALINAVAAANVTNHGRVGRNERGENVIGLVVGVLLIVLLVLLVLRLA